MVTGQSSARVQRVSGEADPRDPFPIIIFVKSVLLEQKSIRCILEIPD